MAVLLYTQLTQRAVLEDVQATFSIVIEFGVVALLLIRLFFGNCQNPWAHATLIYAPHLHHWSNTIRRGSHPWDRRDHNPLASSVARLPATPSRFRQSHSGGEGS